MKNILILCTGNSARSIIAECLFNAQVSQEFHAYSAGSQPTGQPNPYALEILQQHGIDVTNVRSKSWDEYAGDDAPNMDIVITVCDSAASEVCPIWPGAPIKAHWGLPDPAAIKEPDQARKAFAQTYAALKKSIQAFIEAGGETATGLKLQAILDQTKPQISAFHFD